MGLEETGKDGDTLNVLLDEIKYKICFLVQDSSPDKGDNTEANGRPTKIPKMFLQQKEDVSSTDFQKNPALTKGTWEAKDGNKLVVYALGENIMESKPNVKLTQ